ncbi:MAG: sulfurtransferase-like selenium metabolism protein YedF [Defluviitaleaceae bacterium]|nr:sulfurtransferase-like selenium metabolism protein YedF [Defluviitaleaceae bacterium]
MIVINAAGDACPIPVVKAKRAVRESEADATVRITVDNEIATQNLEKMASEMGLGYSCERESESVYIVSLVKGEGAKSDPSVDASPAAAGSSGTVVVISSNTMGSGDDELGASLMKMFIFTLAELDEAPRAVLFYNAGVRLTTEGSGALEDLARLTERGCAVLSCGACLNFFGLQDKLAVGEVTNMLKIVELQHSAARVLRP